jgi:Smg protein
MIDILVYLFERYGEFSQRPKAQALTLKLQAAGFESEEIAEAVEWLATFGEGLAPVRESQSVAPTSRVFTNGEQRCLGTAGLDFICFLERAKILDPALRETIIDRALAVRDESLSLEKLKIIVLMVLWSQSAPLDVLVVEELLGHSEASMH